MSRSRSWLHIALVLAICLQGQPSFAGYKVGTKFADVIMEYVQPGKVYNLRTMRNLPYRVNNRSDGPVDLTIELETPSKEQLKPGYEAIPDPSWIRLVPNRLKLAAGEEGLVDVILEVPAGESYNGRHYQANIICQTADPPPGDVTALVFGVTLSSRLRFSVAGPGPEQVRRMQKQGIYKTLNYTLEPDMQYVPGFMEPGKTVSLSEKGVNVSIVNRGQQELMFSVKSIAFPDGLRSAAGYERGDMRWLKVKPENIKVPAESIRSVKLELELPDDPSLRGRRFMLVVQAGLEGREIPVEVFSRIYFTVAK